MHSKPFRHHLICDRPQTPEDSIRWMKLVDSLAPGNNSWSLSDILEAIRTEAEDVLWLIARFYPLNGYRRDDMKVVVELCDRAIHDADRDGKVWTPVLDLLAANGALDRASKITEGRLPRTHERLALLAPWIQAQRNREDLEDLLRFRAPQIEEVVARNIAFIDDYWFDRFGARLETIDAMTMNPAFDESWRLKLIPPLVMVMEDKKTFSNPVRSQAFQILRRLAGRGRGLPGDLRSRWIRETQHARTQDFRFWLLASDAGINPQNAHRLLHRLRAEPAAELVLSGRISDRQASHFLRDEATAYRVLVDKERLAPEKFLLMIARLHPNSITVVPYLINHPNMTLRVDQELAVRMTALDVQNRFVTFRESSLADVTVRRALIARVADINVAIKLAKFATPEEYSVLFQKAYSWGTAPAVTLLKEARPPRGTRFDSAIIAELLKIDERDSRLMVIQRLSKLSVNPSEPRVTKASNREAHQMSQIRR